MMIFQETETMELKKSTSELKEAIISLVAMLNKHQRGGVIFGIRNDGTVVGQQVSDKTIRDVSKAIADHIEPKVYPVVEQVSIDANQCIKVQVEGGEHPYYAYGRAYIRVADEVGSRGIKMILSVSHKPNSRCLAPILLPRSNGTVTS